MLIKVVGIGLTSMDKYTTDKLLDRALKWRSKCDGVPAQRKTKAKVLYEKFNKNYPDISWATPFFQVGAPHLPDTFAGGCPRSFRVFYLR